MNRAEARVRKFQNGSFQIKSMNDLSLGNSSAGFDSHEKSSSDESQLAKALGRKKKRRTK